MSDQIGNQNVGFLTTQLIFPFQAKKFVESVPVVVKTDLIKEEAETLLKALENAGGKAQID